MASPMMLQQKQESEHSINSLMSAESASEDACFPETSALVCENVFRLVKAHPGPDEDDEQHHYHDDRVKEVVGFCLTKKRVLWGPRRKFTVCQKREIDLMHTIQATYMHTSSPLKYEIITLHNT